MGDEHWTAGFWDERYGSADRIWSGSPNRRLVEQVADLEPGTALDVGCGEGADAVWLAARGWDVTATDVSPVALDRAAAHAPTELAGRLHWCRADLFAWDVEQTFDLVSAQFVVHMPADRREPVLAELAAAVAPGGRLLVVNHHPLDLEVFPRPMAPEFLPTAEDLAGHLDPAHWVVETAATAPRTGTHPEGHEVTLHDAVLRARREN